MNIIDELPKIADLFDSAIKAIGWKPIEVKVHTDSYGDDESPIGWIEIDGFSLYPKFVDIPSIGGPKQVIGYGVDVATVISGTRDYPDVGDYETLLEPVTTRQHQRITGKTNDVITATTYGDAVIKIVLTLVEQRITSALEAEYLNEIATDFDKEVEQWDKENEIGNPTGENP
jgi:hypothetical protein